MKDIAVIFANGTEEIEALTVVDVLRRADVKVDIISINGKYPTGSHKIVVKADKTVESTDFSGYDGIVIPGGMPGATNISMNNQVISAIKKCFENNKMVASICASPAVVLGEHRLIDGKKVTCFPAEQFIKTLSNSVYTGKDVETDGNLITANGPKSAMAFSLKICEYLNVVPKI